MQILRTTQTQKLYEKEGNIKKPERLVSALKYGLFEKKVNSFKLTND